MRGLLDALSVAQRKTVGENVPGAIFIQLGQAGAAFGLFSGVLTAPSAAMLFGPAVVGKLFTNPKFIKFIKRGFQLDPGSPEAYTNAAQLIGAMISNNLISRDEGEDYLEDLKSSMPKNEEIRKKESSQIDKPFILSDDIGLDEEQQLTQMPTQPTRATMATQPANTPPINPSLMATRPTGIMTQATGTMNQGLTPTEQALLSPEEQAIRLRSRGLA
jgi:polyhydroxyalkanoate synthesis regulator phasin